MKSYACAASDAILVRKDPRITLMPRSRKRHHQRSKVSVSLADDDYTGFGRLAGPLHGVHGQCNVGGVFGQRQVHLGGV